MIRRATTEDASRIAEILIFTKRMNYRPIFKNDKVSFGELQVYPLAKEYIDNPERIERGQIGCPYEHWMVNELRKRDGILSLSLVAIVDEIIVGHIICSKAEVRTTKGITPVLNIGPISVLPEYQRKG